MVANVSLGPVQVYSLDIASLNLALRELSERLDALKGLRGRSEIFDRTRVDSPSVATDAVDLQSLLTQESRARLDWVVPPGGLIATTPGTTYAEIHAAVRQQFDFADLTVTQARIMARGWGTESGNGKGVALHDGTNILTEVTWDGHTEALRVGSLTTIVLTADTQLQLRGRGSTATESLILTLVVVEFEITIRVVSA